MSHPWGQSFQFLCPNYQSCWYQRSVQRYSSSLGHRDASSSASSPSLRYHRAEIVSLYSAFSFAFPGPNLTGLQASNGDLLISIKESSTVFACHDSRSSDRYTTSVVLWLYRRLSGTVLKVQPSRAGTQRSDWRQGLCPTCVG